jgi:hypothetical protein
MVERRSGDDGSFLADGLAGSAPSLVFGTGRVCVEPSCNARLSRYNSTEWCALHESPASTQRPYDTSTRQPGRRRNSSTRRRRPTTARVSAGAGTSVSAEDRATATGATAGSKAEGVATPSRRATDPGKARRSTAA